MAASRTASKSALSLATRPSPYFALLLPLLLWQDEEDEESDDGLLGRPGSKAPSVIIEDITDNEVQVHNRGRASL